MYLSIMASLVWDSLNITQYYDSYQALKSRAVCWPSNQGVCIATLLGDKSGHLVEADHTASVYQDVVYNTP